MSGYIMGDGVEEEAQRQKFPAARAAQQPLNEIEDGSRGYSFEV